MNVARVEIQKGSCLAWTLILTVMLPGVPGLGQEVGVLGLLEGGQPEHLATPGDKPDTAELQTAYDRKPMPVPIEGAQGSCFPPELFLADVDGTGGFVIHGALPDEASGYSVSGVGDINGDSIDDFLVGTGNRYPCFWGTAVGHPGNTYVVFGAESLGADGPIDLASLDGTNGFVIPPVDPDDLIFTRVSDVGDINADGINDLLISAALADVNGIINAGQSFVLFGARTIGSSGEFDLMSLDGSNGFVINGTEENDRVGAALSAAGDPNGDGIDDFLVGVRGERCYLVFGGPSPWPPEFVLDDLQGETGVNGTSGVLLRDGTGIRLALSAAGDLNDDGIDDIIIGSGYAGKDERGAGYVVFGRSDTWPAEVDLTTLGPSEGLTIIGSDLAVSLLGLRVSEVGDVNDDGIDDVIISAPPEPNVPGDPLQAAGVSYVIFGSSELGEDGVLSVAELDGSNGFAIPGLEMLLGAGGALSSAGDLNSDGIDDMMLSQAGVAVGFPGGDLYIGNDTYVIFGRAGLGSNGVFDLAALDGTNGFVIHGIEEYDNAGRSIAFVGDVNHDGMEDIILGATGAGAASCKSTAPGASYVIFGRPDSCQICEADLTDDGVVDATDLALLLGSWGPCGDPDDCAADFNGDGTVGPFDLAVLLGSWGPCE